MATVVTREPMGVNPLHSFANYTYMLKIHLLNPATYNDLVNQKTPVFKSNEVLIASGGLKSADSNRHPLWGEDFYIENLKIDSVIGLGSTTRGTNALTIDFTIVEPYGVTLIDRLIRTAAATGFKTHHQMVFALQIDFYGWDDNGSPRKLSGQTKYIPFKIVTMSFKVSERGSEYQISAVPYNHMSLSSEVAVIPTNINVTASTVKEYFANAAAAASTGTVSLTGAINNHELEKVKQAGEEYADEFEVIIDESIGSALLNADSKTQDFRALAMPAGGPNRYRLEVSYGEVKREITAGTRLVEEINNVIRNSKFLLDQLVDEIPPVGADGKPIPMEELYKQYRDKLNKPLVWWKIIPKVYLKEYDRVRCEYSKKYVFEVKPYKVYGSYYPLTPSTTPPVARKYQYIYTGKNTDIISFDLSYDMMYFVAMSANALNLSTTGFTAVSPKEENNSIAAVISDKGPNDIGAPGRRAVTNQMQAMAGSEIKRSPKEVRASDLQEYLYSSKSADMIVLDMNIVGDPSFIKQDDVFVSTGSTTGVDLVNGSIPMDYSEVYVEVIFRSPADVNSATGLVDLTNTATSKSMFSGFYKLISVDSIFEGGKFTQKLNGVRIFTDDVYNSKTLAARDTATINAAQTTVAAPNGLKSLETVSINPTSSQVASVSVGGDTLATGAVSTVQGTTAPGYGAGALVANGTVQASAATKAADEANAPPVKNNSGEETGILSSLEKGLKKIVQTVSPTPSNKYYQETSTN